ncbi:hypothetical protein MCGE09_00216 [Thaumarchaeota archaeon SCGC AB-539-E09]|nr:hypothetical protein MCGE09_00216 [Thaumarchaeota archaeon SCGC AB-539-E09]
MKTQYITNIAQRHRFKLILEVKTKSSSLEELTMFNSEHIVLVKGLYSQRIKGVDSTSNDVFTKEDQFVIGVPDYLPFTSNSFDFIFNSGDLDLNPIKKIREMSRVTRYFVLLFFPNRIHIGDILYNSYVRIFNTNKTLYKHQYSTTLGNLVQQVKMEKLKVFDAGGIDMPLWPSHFSLKFFFGKRKILTDRTLFRLLRIIYYVKALEYAIPKILRAAQAHVVYVVGVKDY